MDYTISGVSLTLWTFGLQIKTNNINKITTSVFSERKLYKNGCVWTFLGLGLGPIIPVPERLQQKGQVEWVWTQRDRGPSENNVLLLEGILLSYPGLKYLIK